MGETLRQAEAGLVSSESETAFIDPGSPSVIPLESATKVDLYDFEHPLPLRPAQMDALRLASASTSQTLQTGLMRLLRNPVVAGFLAVEQSTFRDYLATSESPTCLAEFQSTVSGARWLVEMSRSLAFTIVDCLLGGQPSVIGNAITRPFTEVETRLIAKGLATILRDLSGDLLRTDSLQMVQLASDGELLSEVASNEAVVLVSFEIICGPCQGLIQLCVPWKEVSKTSALAQVASRQPGDRMRFTAAKVPVVVTARVARLRMSARELADLSPGDILVTETESTAEVSLEVDQREIFRGTPAQSHNRKVFLVSSPVSSRPDGVARQGPSPGDKLNKSEEDKPVLDG